MEREVSEGIENIPHKSDECLLRLVVDCISGKSKKKDTIQVS